MQLGSFETEVSDGKILNICKSLLKEEEIQKVMRVCERYGVEEEDVRQYDVYQIQTDAGKRTLKKADTREVFNYEKYLSGRSFRVPQYYGKYTEESDSWILLEHISGVDLREMTDRMAIEAADTLSQIQNAYWNCKDRERFDVYMTRIQKRYEYIKDEPVIGQAYRIFLERQQNCPRTLSNGDFLEFNVLSKDEKVFVIDWGFGGIMPYSLDIARFIAHATEDKATFPFYMNEKQKKSFIQSMYEKLIEKPDYHQYLFDIKLAVLNEYVEFVEAEEDEDKWYYNHAQKLAEEILQ